MDFLMAVKDICPNILGTLTKIDIYPEWKKILELDKGHLKKASVPARLISLSSRLREVAIDRRDQSLNKESGLPTFVRALNEEIVGGAELLATRSAANDVISIAVQLSTKFEAEKEILSDPEKGAEVIGALQEAKARADDLRGRTSKWGQRINDGFSDLNADADYDFRRRIRDVTEEAETALDASDPEQIWNEFEAWLKRRVSAEVTENYALITERIKAISVSAAELFDDAEKQIHTTHGTQLPQTILESTEVKTGRDLERGTVLTNGMNAIRNAYSGFSMFGALGGYAGLAMVNPFTLAVGLLMGGKAVLDDKQRRSGQKRQQAKVAMRKYIDEISFEVGKDSRDSVRHAQRALRDFFAARAEEVQKSVTEALASAQKAVQIDERNRKAQLDQITRNIAGLNELKKHAVALAPELAVTAAPSPR
jgi:hypothetical protein